MATPVEIAASLTMEDIPVKLRCAACNKLAIEAYRMPCCDQSICEDCQASLPEACPVCLHEPVKADDCRPNKALRTTIKVFLKKKVIERDTAEKKKRAAEKAAAIPLPDETSAPKPSQTPASIAPVEENRARRPSQLPATIEPDTEISDARDAKPASRDASQAPQTPNDLTKAAEMGIPTEAQKDIPQMSIESPGPGVARRMSAQTAGDGSIGQEKGDGIEKNVEQQQAAGQNEQWAATNGFAQGMNNGAIGFDGTNGGFPNMSNMGMSGMGDFSQMMQFMPNGMPNPMMGSFPNMMGMPGMGMDPMTMAQMYGGQGMGMNGMNMGMGFDAGQGAFGGFNGQPAAWNTGQNKYNHNAYGGHAGMGGVTSDYGANAGYGGYNMPPHQGNFNEMHQHQYPNNDFHHGHHGQGFQNRGRGRGRGYQNAGRGRGGYNQYNNYNQVQHGNQTNQAPLQQEMQADGVTRRGSPSYGDQEDRPADQSIAENQEDAKAEDTTDNLTAEEQLSKELDPGDAVDNVDGPQEAAPKGEAVPESTVPVVPESQASDQPKAEPKPESIPREEEEKPVPIPTYISEEPASEDNPTVHSDVVVPPTMLPPPNPTVPTGPAAFHAADQSMDTSARGRGYGRGFDRGFHRGGSHGRGSYVPNGNGNISHAQAVPSVVKPFLPPAAPKGLGVEGAPKGPKALREGQRHTGIRDFTNTGRASATTHARPNGASVTKSPSRERSRSPSRHQSTHHRHHRHHSASPSSSTERERRRERHHRSSRRHGNENGDETNDAKGSRNRDASVGSSTKRSSHRSRRDYDREPKDSERSSHRSHRSQRDRSRETEKEWHSSSRRKEKTPELSIYGASRMNGSTSAKTKNNHNDRVEEEALSSRKRRSDDEENYRDHKRKRRGQEEVLEDGKDSRKEDGHRSSHSSRPSKRDSHSHADPPSARPRANSPPQPKEIPKGPKQDNNAHLSEREKYAQERIARENQRRLSQMGPGGGGGGKLANGKGIGRRGGQKYEDDETISRGESEREALRYR